MSNHNLHLICNIEPLDLVCLEKMDFVQQVNGIFQFVPPGPIQLPPKRKASKATASKTGGTSIVAPGPSPSVPLPSFPEERHLADLRFQLHQMDSRLERIERQVSCMAQNWAHYFQHVGFRPPFPPES